jgi:hypothetical protein
MILRACHGKSPDDLPGNATGWNAVPSILNEGAYGISGNSISEPLDDFGVDNKGEFLNSAGNGS